MLGVYSSVWVLTLLVLRSSGSTCCMDVIGYTEASVWCTVAGSIKSGSRHAIRGVDASDIDVKNIEIPGVDVDIQEPQVIEIIDPKIPPTDPDNIEPETVHQADAAVDPMPDIQQVDPKLCRSSRVRTQKEKYTPSMSGSKYSYAVTHLESQGVLNPIRTYVCAGGILPSRA